MGQSHSLHTPIAPVPLAASKNLSPSDLLTLRKRQIVGSMYSQKLGTPASLVTTLVAAQTQLVTPAIAGGMGRSVSDVQSDPRYTGEYSYFANYNTGQIVRYNGNYFLALSIIGAGTNPPVGQAVEQYRNPADPGYSETIAWWSLVTTNRVALGTAPCCSS